MSKPCKPFLWIISIFLCNIAVGQIILPPVNNFTVEQYKGGNQNWGIDSNEKHVFVANNEGLLEFDGSNWYLYQLPNKTIVRSVKIIGDKIYTGSYEEFGYWQRLDNGTLQYESISEMLSQDKLESQSIWSIHEVDDKIIFKSFGAIFVLKSGQIKVIQPGYTLMAANVINGNYIVQGIGQGLLKLSDNKVEMVANTEAIRYFRVQSIIEFENNKWLIGTSLNGCFEFDGEKMEPWDNEINDLLKEHEINTLSFIDGKIVAGTINNGIYQYDLKSKKYININVKNGLLNNTVLANSIDYKKRLWFALDNGLAAIPLDFYIYYLNPFRDDIGAVYDIAHLGDDIYLASNTGIYRVDDSGIHFYQGSQGHTWSFTKVDNSLICGHNSGTFIIENREFSLLSPLAGGYFFESIPNNSNKFIQGNYSGLVLFSNLGDAWETSSIQNLNFAVNNIVFEKSHVAWVSHAYKGVYRIVFSENYDRVLEIQNKYNSSFPNIYDIKLFDIEKNIAFYSDNKWFVYNTIEDRIEDFTSFNKVLGNDNQSIILNKNIVSTIALKRPDNTIYVRKNIQDSQSQKILPLKYYNNKLVRGEGDQQAVIENDSLLYLALYNDVLVVNIKKLSSNSVATTPGISRILKNGVLQDLTNELNLIKKDSLLFELNIPFLSNNIIEYSLDDQNWVKSDGKILLTRLKYGTTRLAIRSLLNVDDYSESKFVILNIAYPWYMDVWGFVVAISISILIFLLIRMINKYVLIKHKNYLEEQFNHEQEIFKKEEAIKSERIEKELLRKQHVIELNLKTKELANTALGMTKKDEILEQVKGELDYFKGEIIDKSRFEKLLVKLQKNIKTKKDWKVFESNLNEIHDSFFKALIERHPNLSSKDLKLCAYLKMNLSTKEITPIMGISVRGVELHRYRLRKKLQLQKNQNLFEYFMNF